MPVRRGHVRAAVAIQVSNGNRKRSDADGVWNGCGERPRPVSAQEADRVAAWKTAARVVAGGDCRQYVQMAVTIEIGHRDSFGNGAHRVFRRGSEGAITFAEKNSCRSLGLVCGHEIDSSVL